jgi:uncharacterized membrane protein YcaP (DUF421 family)
MAEPLYVIDTGGHYDRPIQKGQWTVSDIPGNGAEIVSEWLSEKGKELVNELRYARLEGTGKINVFKMSDHFDIEVSVSVSITPSINKKKTPVKEESSRRKAAR